VAPSSIFSNISGSPIMQSEVVYAFSTLKNRKVLGEHNIHMEVLKLVNTKKFCQLFNAIYDSGIFGDWLTHLRHYTKDLTLYLTLNVKNTDVSVS
jgi:hypothetical protein